MFNSNLYIALLIAASFFSEVRAELPTQDFWLDARVVHETALVNFTDAEKLGSNWAIVRAELDPAGGVEPGLPVVPPSAGLGLNHGFRVDLKVGTAQTIALLSGSVPDGSWPCLIPVPPQENGFGHPPIYEIDRSAGVCICRVPANIDSGRAPVLDKVSLIPDSWAKPMAKAFEFWRANKDIFDPRVDPQRHSRLLALLKDDNPAVGFIAMERLTEAREIALGEVPREMFAANDDLAVIETYLLLHTTSSASQRALADQLLVKVNSAPACDELHGIALACALDLSTAPAGRPEGGAEDRASYLVLLQIEHRLASARKDGSSDDYLASALQPMQHLRHLLEFAKSLQQHRGD